MRSSVVRAGKRFTGRYRLAAVIAVVFALAITAAVVTAGGGTAPAARHDSPAAPDFTVAVLGAKAQQVTLSRRFAGQPVIVNFWASWCDPCQRETPLLAGWYRHQRGTVNLIGLDENDSAASAVKFAKAKGVTYPLGFDPQTRVAEAYGVAGAGIPQTFFLDARHHVVDHVYGALTRAVLMRGLKLARG